MVEAGGEGGGDGREETKRALRALANTTGIYYRILREISTRVHIRIHDGDAESISRRRAQLPSPSEEFYGITVAMLLYTDGELIAGEKRHG